MSDVKDAGFVWFGIANFLDVEDAGIGDDVGVGEELIFADEESGTGAATGATSVPGSAIVRDERIIFDTNDRGVVADAEGLRGCG